jgi:hypothetical protein
LAELGNEGVLMPRRTARQTEGQLKMFMTPREVMEGYSSHIGDRDPYGRDRYLTNRDTFKHKRQQNIESGLHEDVRLNGVQFPIGLGQLSDTDVASTIHRRDPMAVLTGKKMLTAGHHRLAAAYEHAPDTPIPVLHHKDIVEHQGWAGHVPESHIEHETVRTEGGTVSRKPIMVGMTNYETPKVAQPWGHYR